MADQTWNISEEARMELYKYSYITQYKLLGSGSLKDCRSHISNYYNYDNYRHVNILLDNEVILGGHFDIIEDDCFNKDIIKRITISDGSFKHVGNRAFRSPKLEGFTLPETVESIGHNNFNGVFTTFNIPAKITDFPADNLIDCQKLESITVSECNTSYKVVDGILYNYDMTEIVFCPNAKAGSVIIPNTIKRIGDYCFYGCRSLKTIVIPPSVKAIGASAFAKIKIDKLVLPNSIASIGEDCFLGATIKDVQMSAQVDVFPANCFKGATITSLKYNYSNLKHLGEHAIDSDSNSFLPQSVSLNQLEDIGAEAFRSCDSVLEFLLYSSIEKICDSAFWCSHKNVKIRYFSYAPIRIDDNAFKGIGENATLVVPQGTKLIFKNTAPWSTIPNIEELALDKDIAESGENTETKDVIDDTYVTRLRSVADSKNKADRYYLQEILEDLSLSYLSVDSEEEYEEALSVISYNRSFSPAIIPNLEAKICQNWTNKYKLRLINHTLIDNPATPLLLKQEVTNAALPVVDAISLPVLDVAQSLSEPQKTSSHIQTFFDESILKQIQNNISLARHSLKIAVSWFTNYSLFKQVKDIAMSGVKIQLITNNDLTNNGGYCLDLNELIASGVEISLIEYPHLLHHKFCIIDDSIVINGSYNWTRFSAKNYENITVISGDEEVVSQFNDEFETLLDNAEHKKVDKMPDCVPERPEYDRSAFKQYVTEELDAQARETSDERDKITALQTAVKLNPEYLQKLNPTAKEKYAEAFKVVEESKSIQKSIVSMVKGKPTVTQPSKQATSETKKSTSSTSSNSSSTTNDINSNPTSNVVTANEKDVIKTVAASGLLMALDVSGSMDNTYKQGHVHSITKKALSASLAISESKEVAVWTFGDNAAFVENIGIDKLDNINRIVCKNQGTNLNSFVTASNNSIKDGALVVIFTDDDASSIQSATNGMKQRTKVFWQIIVCGTSSASIEKAITNVDNTSVVSLTDYSSKTDEEISQILLKDYINWKKQNSQ